MKIGKAVIKQRVYKTLLLLVSLCISLAACEIVLRIISSEEYYVRTPGTKRITKPQQGVMPGISGENRFYINSFGIRGDTFRDDQDYRILAIGGSTTECFYLDELEAWPYLVQEILNENQQHNVWVGNVGRSGHNSKHHIAQVQILLKQYPKIDAILILVGINDFDKRLRPDKKYKPFPAFESLDPQKYSNLLTEAFAVIPPNSRLRLPFYRRTEIEYRLQKIRWHFKYRELNQDNAGRFYIKRRKYRQSARVIRTTLPHLSSALEEYSRNLHAIIDLSRERGTRMIFVTQPTLWKHGLPQHLRNLLWFGGLGQYKNKGADEYYSVEALADGMRMYNETLKKVCRSRNVECIDLAPLLPADTTVFYDDCHFNEPGSKKVAKIIAEYLLRENKPKLLTSKGN